MALQPRSISSSYAGRTGGRLREYWGAAIAIGALLCLAVVFGGGGVRYALANLLVQLSALALLAIRRDAVIAFWREAPAILRLLIVLSVAVPVSQLIPLPQSVWSDLPGRDLVAQSFELSGRTGWAPASVDPVRTLVALTGLIVPIAIISAGWTLSRDNLVLLTWIIVALGLANLLIGIPQVLSEGSAGAIYTERGLTSILNGTFANRNSTGLFFVAAIGFAALAPSPVAHPAILPTRIALCVLLSTGVILTQSRTALALAVLPLGLAALRAITWTMHSRATGISGFSKRMRTMLVAGLALALGALAATVVMAPGRVGDTMERFQSIGESRSYTWEDTAFAARRYWPVGAGMGTFDEVFQVDESLENATLKRPGRAHNDYLEVAVEAGIAGLALIAIWLAYLAWLTLRARKSPFRWCAWAGSAILFGVALQSITDYPLRNQAMLAVASFALLVLVRLGSEKVERDA
ncbi:O-antigen ligase [Erythrobacter sp. THAF29]|uniref:O-antigen ligase family protein n=1 Tax=Erythrobacter sp. THAF29 TaxID=2587851 RepID=UPI001269645E|nr:O-antigen ligase family protein [Erythrobacter sp. THAF29]QFT75988.1 O-Antigen ligase [Erythrobacter sp. THAF29]